MERTSRYEGPVTASSGAGENRSVPCLDTFSRATPHSEVISSCSNGIVEASDRAVGVADAGEPSLPCVVKKHVLLPARSLVVLSGPARTTWAHGIAPRKYDKVPALYSIYS